MTIVYRVQDADGRGPFKPGFSRQWVEDNREFNLPPWFVEFGADLIQRSHGGMRFFGSACRSMEQLRKWFTETELNRLFILGYRVVEIQAETILAESEHQLVFGRTRPLSQLP